MSNFAIRNPYLIVVLCFVVMILGGVSTAGMPVDMFPPIELPVVAVATFYNGMPPQQIETNLTYHLERMFTLASGIDHMESRSLPGASLIKGRTFQCWNGPATRTAAIDRHPGHERSTRPATGNLSAHRIETGCIQHAGCAGDAAGKRTR